MGNPQSQLFPAVLLPHVTEAEGCYWVSMGLGGRRTSVCVVRCLGCLCLVLQYLLQRLLAQLGSAVTTDLVSVCLELRGGLCPPCDGVVGIPALYEGYSSDLGRSLLGFEYRHWAVSIGPGYRCRGRGRKRSPARHACGEPAVANMPRLLRRRVDRNGQGGLAVRAASTT